MGDGDADPQALRQGAPWEGVSHGRLPAEKTLSVVSVNVFRFLILWVKNYILRLGRSRPERQAPRQSGALVAPMQGRPQLQLQGFVMQPPGLGHRQGSGQPGRRGTVGAEPVPWAWSRPRRGGPHAARCWGSSPPHPSPHEPRPLCWGGLPSSPFPPSQSLDQEMVRWRVRGPGGQGWGSPSCQRAGVHRSGVSLPSHLPYSLTPLRPLPQDSTRETPRLVHSGSAASTSFRPSDPVTQGNPKVRARVVPSGFQRTLTISTSRAALPTSLRGASPRNLLLHACSC